MKLSLNLEEEEEQPKAIFSPVKIKKGDIEGYVNTFERKLMRIVKSHVFNGKKYEKSISQIIGFMRKYYVEQIRCKVITPSFSGAFGEVEIDRVKNEITKRTNLFDIILRDLESAHLSEKKARIVLRNLISTLRFCPNIQTLGSKMKKLFPENIVTIKECKHCGTDKIYFLIKTDLAKGDDMGRLLKQGKISNEDLLKIEIQLVYIAETLNRKKIYHNDYTPRNIMIDLESRRNIKYTSGKFNLELKNTLVPVLIDYDFINKRPNFNIAGQEGYDMSLYHYDTQSKKLKTFSNELYESYKKSDLDAIKKIMKDNEVSGMKISSKTGGSRKKGKKSKKIRKHVGINQKTGRLKKGYKYTGKKTKTGLSIISKIK